MRTDIKQRKQEIEQWISENKSKHFMCRELKCKQDTLNSWLDKMGIVYAGNMSGKGLQRNTYMPFEEYANSTYISSHKLKLKLIRDGIKEAKCECCGIFEWMNKPAPLELDHIDGDHYNNVLNNLRILCSNCHAQTDTNSGKNKGRVV